MAQIKTRPGTVSAVDWLAAVVPETRRAEGHELDALFRRATGQEPVLWGPSIVGYGRYRYRYASGHGGEMCRVGFSPRKAKHSLYISCTCDGPEAADYTALLGRLGKHALGQGGCLYVNKLAQIDLAVLEAIVTLGWQQSFARWPD